MNMVNESFRLLFDKTLLNGYAKTVGIWRIHENDKSATFTDLDVVNPSSEFYGFDQSLTKSMKDITEKRSTKLKDRECDGIAFVVNKQKECLLLVELKSKYDTSPISDAIKQMCYSFLKLHAMMSLCDSYSLSEMPIAFCAATRCEVSEDEKAKVEMFISQAMMCEEQKEFGAFFNNLFDKHIVSIRVLELFRMFGIVLPLQTSIVNKDITVHLALTSASSDSSTRFHI